MAKQTKGASKAPTIAAAKAALARAKAELARAEAAAEPAAEDPDEDEDPAPDASDDIETEAAAEEPAEGEEDEGEGQSEAQKIAASPEAAANPALATAAIRDGLTLAQFQGQAKAADAGGGKRQLESVLAGSPRLGADAPGKKAEGLDVKSIYSRRAERRRGAR